MYNIHSNIHNNIHIIDIDIFTYISDSIDNLINDTAKIEQLSDDDDIYEHVSKRQKMM
jgi:hypothetical protein